MKYYAVRRGHVPGIYEDWSECEAQVKGFAGASYKSFKTLREAEAFLNEEEEPPKKQQQTVEEAVPAPKETVPVFEEEAPAWPEIYVDGSFRADTGEYAYGMVVLEGGEELTFCEKFDDPELAQMRNVAGEIRGAQAAMEYALKEGWDGLYLYHDYAGIAHWCTGVWKASKPGTMAYRDFYQSIKKRLSVRFVKVKGHSHNRLNDLADQLAKQALGIREEEEEEQETKEGPKENGT